MPDRTRLYCLEGTVAERNKWVGWRMSATARS